MKCELSVERDAKKGWGRTLANPAPSYKLLASHDVGLAVTVVTG
jgi:hypothetical protein